MSDRRPEPAPSGHVPANRRGDVDVVRVYAHPDRPGRHAVLVDRLWPRGIKKSDAPFDLWLKEVAPSTELRTWYGHRPERFAEFAARYRQELTQSPAREALEQLRAMMGDGKLLLITATRAVDQSAAAVLHDVLLGI